MIRITGHEIRISGANPSSHQALVLVKGGPLGNCQGCLVFHRTAATMPDADSHNGQFPILNFLFADFPSVLNLLQGKKPVYLKMTATTPRYGWLSTEETDFPVILRSLSGKGSPWGPGKTGRLRFARSKRKR